MQSHIVLTPVLTNFTTLISRLSLQVPPLTKPFSLTYSINFVHEYDAGLVVSGKGKHLTDQASTLSDVLVHNSTGHNLDTHTHHKSFNTSCPETLLSHAQLLCFFPSWLFFIFIFAGGGVSSVQLKVIWFDWILLFFWHTVPMHIMWPCKGNQIWHCKGWINHNHTQTKPCF